VRREHRRFLIADELVGAAIVNFLLNCGIAWFFTRGRPSVAASGVASDTIATAFVLPVLTALVAWPLVHIQVARGKLPRLSPEELGAWSRRHSLVRGAAVGLVLMLLVAFPALHFAVELPTARFIWVKGLIAAGLGAFATPLIGWWALQHASRAGS
jgi:hypothetical protein